MTHPDQLTGADVFDVPDDSLSPTDPGELVAWLRALPLDTILRDERGEAWKFTEYPGRPLSRPVTRPFQAFACTGEDELYLVRDEGDMAKLAGFGPFRLIWSTGGRR